MGKLHFSIVANLVSEGVRQGAARINSALAGIKMQAMQLAGMFGAGLGVAEFIRTVLEASKKLEDARVKLKNVSRSQIDFYESQKFVMTTARKYRQDISTLTGAFSGFKAAADNAGMSVANQQKIFESMSKASATFGLSVDDARGAMLAITQMMGKGRVASEELRRQLGERIPIAIQAMAAGNNMTVEQMERMMKAGKLLASDALPGFAAALLKMSNFQGLETPTTAITELGNQITLLAEKTNAADIFTKAVKGVTELVRAVGDGLNNILHIVVAVVGGKLGAPVFRFFQKVRINQKALTEAARLSALEAAEAGKRKAAALKAHEDTITAYNTREGGKRLATAKQVADAEVALSKAKAAELKANQSVKSASDPALAAAKKSAEARKNYEAELSEFEAAEAGKRIAAAERVAETRKALTRAVTAEKTAAAAAEANATDKVAQTAYRAAQKQAEGARAANRKALDSFAALEADKGKATSRRVKSAKAALDRAAEAEVKAVEKTAQAKESAEAAAKTASLQTAQARIKHEQAITAYNTREGGKRLATEKQVRQAQRALNKAEAAEEVAIQRQKAAAELERLRGSSAGWRGMFRAIKLQAVAVGASLKAMAMSFAPMAVIALITGLISKLVEMGREAKRVANIFNEYRKELDAPANSEEIERLRLVKRLINDNTASDKARITAAAGIKDLTGIEVKNVNDLRHGRADINRLLSIQIAKMETIMRQERALTAKLDAEKKLKELGVTPEQAALVPEAKRNLERAEATIAKHILEFSIDPGIKQRVAKAKSYLHNNLLKDAPKKSNRAIREIENTYKVYKDADKESYELQNKIKEEEAKRTPPAPTPDDEPKLKAEKPEKSPLQEAEEKYAKAMEEAANRYAATKEHNPAEALKDLAGEIDNISETAAKEIGGILGEKARDNATFQKAFEVVKNRPDPRVAEAEEDFRKKKADVAAMLESGAISQKEAGDIMLDASERAAREIGSAAGAAAKNNEVYREAAGSIAAHKEATKPKLQERDTTFDYRTRTSERLGDEIALMEKYIDDLQRWGDTVDGELTKIANAKVLDLRAAMKLEQVREDVKALNKELARARYDGIKDIAMSCDRLAKGFTGIGEALEKMDTAPLEGLFGLFNGVIQVIDTINSVISAISAISEAAAKAAGAEAAYDTVKGNSKLALAAKTVTANTSVATSYGVEAAAAAPAAAAVSAKAAADVAAANAATALAISTGATAVAGIPVVGPGLAAAAAASISAAIVAGRAAAAYFPGFAQGGIFKGAFATGDRMLARVNAGEMILNDRQQSNLFKMLDAGRSANAPKVVLSGELTADGKKLAVLLRQAERRMSR